MEFSFRAATLDALGTCLVELVLSILSCLCFYVYFRREIDTLGEGEPLPTDLPPAILVVQFLFQGLAITRALDRL